MITFSKFILIFGLFLNVVCCANAQRADVTYEESDEDFPNPERGFYIPLDTHGGNFVPLNSEKLISDRIELKKHGSARYAVYSTLLYRGYVLDSFVNKPLSESFLTNLDNDFKAVRDAGIKMILRFAYTNKTHSGNCRDKEKICPPYGDASKQVMLNHIAQLKPIFRKNADVIAVLQEGFIGIWGENYYTDYFGDPSDNGAGKINDENWHDRNDILKALLDALPKERMVQVRTPQIKQKFVYGPQAAVDSKPATDKIAFDFSDRSRISFHNDCFLASIDDYGTYFDYGSSATPKQSANEVLRKYVEADSRFGPVGGETCDDAFSPANDCAPAGHAEEEMRAMHYSFLNTAYNNTVNNDWDSLGCMNSIKKNLGYRFVLRKGNFPKEIKAGKQFMFSIDLENKGYASPFNPRPLIFVLRNQQTGKEYFISCKTDILRWFSGKINWRETLRLPSDIIPGQYKLLLHFADASASVSKRPEYAIRLANRNVWEEKTGFNYLNFIIKVSR